MTDTNCVLKNCAHEQMCPPHMSLICPSMKATYGFAGHRCVNAPPSARFRIFTQSLLIVIVPRRNWPVSSRTPVFCWRSERDQHFRSWRGRVHGARMRGAKCGHRVLVFDRCCFITSVNKHVHTPSPLVGAKATRDTRRRGLTTLVACTLTVPRARAPSAARRAGRGGARSPRTRRRPPAA